MKLFDFNVNLLIYFLFNQPKLVKVLMKAGICKFHLC